MYARVHFVFAEDQQAFEDEGGIVIQPKQGLPPIRIPQNPTSPPQLIAPYPQIQYPYDPFYYPAATAALSNQSSESLRRRKVQQANEAMFSSTPATPGSENAFPVIVIFSVWCQLEAQFRYAHHSNR